MEPRSITLKDLLDCIKNGRIGGDQPVLSAPTEHVGGFSDVTVGPNDPRVRAGAAGASKDDGMIAAFRNQQIAYTTSSGLAYHQSRAAQMMTGRSVSPAGTTYFQ